jgi:mannose-1-phosphate guanylyltransferase
MKVIIMAGGNGTRFWPLSNKNEPKQFKKIFSHKSMLQESFDRYKRRIPLDKIFVITSNEFKDLVIEQLPEIKEENILIEPVQRDTGPCIAFAAMHFLKRNDDEVLVTTPSDQYISDNEKFMDTIFAAEKLAQLDKKVLTLGINPTRPETGYGYMKALKENNDSTTVLKVQQFIEKPSYEEAQRLIDCNNIYWNSGIYIWKPSTIEYYMKKYQPALWKSLHEHWDNLTETYPKLKKVSIDYSIIEHAEEVYMMPINFDWDDLGTWNSIERIYDHDENKNILIGDIHAYYSENCTAFAENCKTIVIGTKDLIIVQTKDGVLVCHKSYAEHLKDFIQKNI